MHQFTNIDIGFDVMNPFGTKWEESQKKRKEYDNLLFPLKLEPTTLTPIEEANDD
ncbi:hypothetical protein J1N35_014058 [Gossypium stocksii]|uniref:Uncharacterized protein n=1 Tax=Gossypium stocksii TaxID=47602 RepID=A0A9D3VTR2_9ROSI|nr:hypothetical protein J1N35_014058 [Gossypium stocksii]